MNFIKYIEMLNQFYFTLRKNDLKRRESVRLVGFIESLGFVLLICLCLIMYYSDLSEVEMAVSVVILLLLKAWKFSINGMSRLDKINCVNNKFEQNVVLSISSANDIEGTIHEFGDAESASKTEDLILTMRLYEHEYISSSSVLFRGF
jgi:hypothetical protein